jgi:hypothetical protein
VTNRATVILKYKEPAIRWIVEADPVDGDLGVTVDSFNEDLISDGDGDTSEALERWIKRKYKTLFEEELEGWYIRLCGRRI